MTMTIRDALDLQYTGANRAALDHYEHACQEFRCYLGDPVGSTQRALAAAPQMTMAHALLAWLNLLGTEPGGLPGARDALDKALALPANERESAHLAAIEHLVHGRWQRAGLALEDLSVRYPRDLVALQAGHGIDFFMGHSRMLRDRIARAYDAWQPGMSGFHAVLGMYAFGLEENGDYARAEALGRRCVELEPRDGWGWHAVAHVMEMQNRRHDGIAWMRRDMPAWSDGSYFVVHNSWHLALFHLGLDQIDEVYALLDERVLGSASPVVLDMIDASAMLWRLQLRGLDVGTRWNALADRWAAVADAGNYAFNDFHAMMAFCGAGRETDAERLLAAQARALCAEGDNAMFVREVGADATAAVQAFSRGRYGETVRRLRPLRSHAHRFGGSHAQRDLIDLTLIEAAARDGQNLLADALRRERASRIG
jgi:tetratricopeptide (TPR) repeat protein